MVYELFTKGLRSGATTIGPPLWRFLLDRHNFNLYNKMIALSISKTGPDDAGKHLGAGPRGVVRRQGRSPGPVWFQDKFNQCLAAKDLEGRLFAFNYRSIYWSEAERRDLHRRFILDRWPFRLERI